MISLLLFVYTHENQFGFKKQHGADTCIYVMKEIIKRYQRLGSNHYLCFLDASKVFDRINHDTLLKKLVNINVLAYIIRLLVFWYSHQLARMEAKFAMSIAQEKHKYHRLHSSSNSDSSSLSSHSSEQAD